MPCPNQFNQTIRWTKFNSNSNSKSTKSNVNSIKQSIPFRARGETRGARGARGAREAEWPQLSSGMGQPWVDRGPARRTGPSAFRTATPKRMPGRNGISWKKTGERHGERCQEWCLKRWGGKGRGPATNKPAGSQPPSQWQAVCLKKGTERSSISRSNCGGPPTRDRGRGAVKKTTQLAVVFNSICFLFASQPVEYFIPMLKSDSCNELQKFYANKLNIKML